MIDDVVKRCLHQVITSKSSILVRNNHKGNCYECIYDKDNEKCNGYVPISIYTIGIKNHKV